MSTLNCWMCRHPNVSQSKDRILIDSIVKEKLTLECPICYDTFDLDNLFFTECKHYACVKCTDSMFKKNANNQLSSRRIVNRQLVMSNIANAIERIERDYDLPIHIYSNFIITNNITISNNNNMHNPIDSN